MAEQGDLGLEPDLALGSALDAGRAGGPGHDGVEGHQPLRPVGPVDQARRDLAVAVPRPQRRPGDAGLGLGLAERHPGRGVELGEQLELGLPPGQPVIPVRRHGHPYR